MPVSSGYPKLDTQSGRGIVLFDAVSVASVTINFRAVLLYNASKSNRAIAIFDKGIDSVLTSGTLKLIVNPISNNLLSIA